MVPLTGQNTINDMVDRINEVSQEIQDVASVNANAVLGPASSSADQIMAFSDATGKKAKAANISPFAYSILDDADEAAARATLGLKSAAVLDAATAATANTAVQRDANGNITGVGITATSGFVGNGSQITSLDMNNAASGTLDTEYGGTGTTSATGTGSTVRNTSPTLAGTPTAPTAAVGTNTTQLATTAFVKAEIANDAPSKTGAGASGSWGISVTGNAATATKLATASTINGVAFDGSANITVADATKLPLTGGTVTGTITNNGVSYAIDQRGEIGGAYLSWNNDRMYTVQVSCANNYAAYGGIRWTKWGERHLGAIDCYAGGTNSSAPRIDFHVGYTANAFAFHEGGHFVATGNVTAYSDIRLKTDIKVIPEALDKVTQLRGVTYKRIDSGERQVGVIAQEVQAVLPEAVMEGSDEDKTLSVAYGNLAGLLIESIKELNGKVDSLQKELDELRRAT